MLTFLKTLIAGRSRQASTAQNIVWNYIGYLYQVGISFGLTAYITRHLAVPEYGLFLFVMSLSSTLYLLDMGISSVLVQAYVAEASHENAEGLNALLSTSFVALGVLGAAGAAIFSGIAALLPGPFKIPGAYLHEASIVFLIAACIVLVSFPGMAVEQAYQASNRFDRINHVQLISTTVQAVLSIYVLAAGFRIVGLALAVLAATVLRLALLGAALPACVPGARLTLHRFEWDRLKPLIAVSKWAFLQNLSASLFDLLVWTMIGALGSMRDAALYGLASKLPAQFKNLVDKGANVALPLLSNAHARNDAAALQRTYLSFQKLIFGASIPFLLLGCYFARPLIELWAGRPYGDAAPVMQWLLLAAFAHAVAYSSDLLLYACSKIKEAASISIWSGTVSVVSALLLVGRFGAVGLAAGLAISQLVLHAGWFTLAASRLSGTRLRAITRVWIDGVAVPFALMAAEVLLIAMTSARWPELWILAAAVVSGATYLAVWFPRTAMPLYRQQMAGALQP